MRERLGALEGRTLTYLGDGNNVAHSLLLGRRQGGHAGAGRHPRRVRADPAGRAAGGRDRRRDGRRRRGDERPGSAAAPGADVLYTDVWASMGQEAEADERMLVFTAFQVTQALVDVAADDVVVLHCLPAHRGQEIAAEVIDGPRSAVWDQAENRLHTQKALLLRLLGAA